MSEFRNSFCCALTLIFELFLFQFLTPLYHFSSLQRHLDINQTINAESLPLHMTSGLTQKSNPGFNPWLLSATCELLSCYYQLIFNWNIKHSYKGFPSFVKKDNYYLRYELSVTV